MNTDNKSSLIKVQVIDRQQIALWGIDQLIKQDGRFHLCATATNTEDGMKLAISSNPDVIVLDPELGEEDGIELISSLINKTKFVLSLK